MSARKRFLSLMLLFAMSVVAVSANGAEPVRYLRFHHGDQIAYGILEGERVRQLAGDLFASPQRTDTTYAIGDVKILTPTKPTQVLALAGNYRSHLNDTKIPPKFQIPQPFYKSPSCLIAHDEAIVIPKDAKTVHYEAELVVVIGKKCSKVSKQDAMDYVFGVTVGNDIITGTPGQTSTIKPGDVVEVELEGVGTLRNPVKGDQ
jgi:2-keto-4-pentenoate hydratase/2-oxohepta-3-ene-1,7-dioic acid hydratase in catechol pathway